LVPGYEAPVYLTWGKRDRTSLVRIPAANDISRRTELRTPDSSCNPYLAMAVMLSAGVDGIKRRIDPGEPVEARTFYENEERRREEGVEMLPRTLGDALDELIRDDVIRDALGKVAYDEFMASATLDWNDHCSQVMDWELERYINI
jgi:glutamine synthetase